MARGFCFTLAVFVVMLLTSCVTGGNVYNAEPDSSARLTNAPIEDRAIPPRTVERPIDEVLGAPVVPQEEVTASVIEEEPIESIEEETVAADMEEMAADDVIGDESATVEEETIVEEIEEIEEVEEAIVPVADIVSEEEEVVIEEEEAVVEDVPEEAVAEEELSFPTEVTYEPIRYKIDGWMMALLIVSIVTIVFYTIATAIRSGAKRPIPRILSVLLSIIFVAVPWVCTALIAGNSYFWILYLVLLITYFIFRSGNQRHHPFSR